MSTTLATERSRDSQEPRNQEPVTLSIVIPCLNEEICIGEFVEWCHQGLKDAGISGEILIVDSSTDRSPEIAAAHGARVLRVPNVAWAGPTLTRFPTFVASM